MSRQWLRKCQILVGDPAGNAIDMSELRCTFVVTAELMIAPMALDLFVYNAAPETIRKVDREFTRVVINAGYEGNFGKIFDGQIYWRRYGRSSPVDTYLHIQAADTDQAITYSFVNTTLAAGYTQRDVHDTLVEAMQSYGIKGSRSPNYDPLRAGRGKVLFGLVRDHWRTHAKTNETAVSVRNGVVSAVPLLAYAPGDAFVLTSRTGLIGFPQLTLNGVEARCLLNPAIDLHRRVKIDQASVQDIAISPEYTAVPFRPDIAADGMYKVIWYQHCGDTRGNDWQTDMICVAVDGALPASRAALFMGAPDVP